MVGPASVPVIHMADWLWSGTNKLIGLREIFAERLQHFPVYFVAARSYGGSHRGNQLLGIALESTVQETQHFARNPQNSASPSDMNRGGNHLNRINEQKRYAIRCFNGRIDVWNRTYNRVCLRRSIRAITYNYNSITMNLMASYDLLRVDTQSLSENSEILVNISA